MTKNNFKFREKFTKIDFFPGWLKEKDFFALWNFDLFFPLFLYIRAGKKEVTNLL
jgi:hypothetical protein